MGGSVAVALVTRNAQAWIDQLLDSILAQTRQPDAIVIVDDHSKDDTLQRITRTLGSSVTVLHSTSTAKSGIDRIAENFTQAVRACDGYEAVILGDHDDVWLPDRIGHQLGLLERSEDLKLAMVASNGRIIDAEGDSMGRTLRDNFPVSRVGSLSKRDMVRLALTHLVATGGASCIRPEAFPTLKVPRGWLHDRWWSLVAAVRGGLVLDDHVVIDYRVHHKQQAGLERGAHGAGFVARFRSVGPLTTTRKLWQLNRDLRPIALTDELSAELRIRALLRTYGMRRDGTKLPT